MWQTTAQLLQAKSVVGVVLQAPEPIKEEAGNTCALRFRAIDTVCQEFQKQMATNEDEEEADNY